MIRYIYHKKNDQVYKTNLGFFQNKYADRIAERQKKAGIESEYDSVTGDKNRTKISPELFGDSKQSAEELKKKIDTRYPKANAYIVDGKVYIDNENMGARENRKMEKFFAKKAGYSGVNAAINGRVMSNRAGFVLHPLNKLDRKANKKVGDAYQKWRDQRREKIGQGEEVNRTYTPKDSDDPENPPTDEDVAEGEKISSDAQNEFDKFKASNGFRASVGIAAVVGVGCTLKDLDEGYDQTKEAEVIMPSIRMALDIISLGAQVQAGDDFSLEQLNWYAKLLHGKDSSGDRTDFNQANSLLGEEGKKDKGYPESETLKTLGEGSPFAFINEGVLGEFLGPACSTAGQIVSLAIGVITGPVSAGAGLAFSQAMGPVVQQAAIDFISGTPINPDAVGADYGNIVNYGSRLASNSAATSMGGQAMSTEEEGQLAQSQREDDRKEFQEQPLFARIFNVYDHRSVASNIIDGTSTKTTENINNIASGLISPSTYVKKLNSVFLPRASADNAVYDYGFPEIGFSMSELDRPDLENPYQNADEVVNSILPADEDNTYINRASTCFGVTIDDSTYEVTPDLDNQPSFDTVNSDECKNNGEEWTKVRFFIFDSNVATSAMCYEGDDESCAKTGVSTASSDTSGSVPEGVECPDNLSDTKKVGSTTYYKMPDSPDGEWTFDPGAAPEQRYGHKELVCMIYTVAKNYKEEFGEKSTVKVGDLNASGHASHNVGIAVDINAWGQIAAGDTTQGGYDTDATIEFGKMFVATGLVKNIWWCPNDDSSTKIQSYAESINKPITIQCIEGHHNHFHVDINVPPGDFDEP